MLEELLPFYERELGEFRALSAEFASRFPKVARRLQLEDDSSEDPHVERLIEGFAFLTARVRKRLEDDGPELAEAFMQLLYPHYNRPIPSAALLQLSMDPAKPEVHGRYVLPRHTTLLSPPVLGVRCPFRICQTLELWPLEVQGAEFQWAQASEELRRRPSCEAAVTLELASLGGLELASLGLDSLQIHLDGAPGTAALLYESLAFRLLEVQVLDGKEVLASLPGAHLQPMGFLGEEALLEPDPRSFPGYRLLTEYFAFPEKFMFFRLSGLDQVSLPRGLGRVRVRFLLSRFGTGSRHLRLASGISADNFRLGCVPAVNLFPHSSEPIRVTHRRSSHPVVVDSRRPWAFDVHSIDRVARALGDQAEGQEEVPPFYSLPHAFPGEGPGFSWCATREESPEGSGLRLSLVESDPKPRKMTPEVLSLHLTCSNRRLPESLPFGGGGEAQDSFLVPGHSVVRKAQLLRKPSPSQPPPSRTSNPWTLLAHLCLSHLSLAEHGKDLIQEALRLYRFQDSPVTAKQVQGIRALEARPATARLWQEGRPAFVRGVEVHLTLDESCFVGSNHHLFANVLERFFAQLCGPNSFVRFSMSTLQESQETLRWPPRTGETPLI
jgi:type VI secretion system protein ImpG